MFHLNLCYEMIKMESIQYLNYLCKNMIYKNLYQFYYKIKLNESHPVYLFIFFVIMMMIFIWGIYKGIQNEKRKKLEVIKKKKDDDFKGENDNNNENNKKVKNPKDKKNLNDNDEKAKLINKNK